MSLPFLSLPAFSALYLTKIFPVCYYINFSPFLPSVRLIRPLDVLFVVINIVVRRMLADMQYRAVVCRAKVDRQRASHYRVHECRESAAFLYSSA